jgi:hypothetical protein
VYVCEKGEIFVVGVDREISELSWQMDPENAHLYELPVHVALWVSVACW